MHYFKTTMCLLAILAIASCDKARQDEGRIDFGVADSQITEITKSQTSDYTTMPDAGSFSIRIEGTNYEWTGAIGEWDAATKLKVGNYTVKAAYGEEGQEGFDKPRFEGSTSFVVLGGESTLVKIPVKLENCLVRLSCTEGFKKYYPAYSFKLTTIDSVIDFPATETRAAFIEAARMSISGSLTNQNGKTVAMEEKTFTGLKPATCYTVIIDAANVGGASISITFNNETEIINLEEDLND